MKSTLATKITSETSDPLKDLVKAYGDLKVKSHKLESENREFKLLIREYFQTRSKLNHADLKDWQNCRDLTKRSRELERRILRELEAFTRQDIAELPFSDEDETRI